MEINQDDVKRLFGEISDHTVVEILDTGATLPELEAVAAYLAQEDDVMGKQRHPLTGRELQIHEMLQRQEDAWNEDR